MTTTKPEPLFKNVQELHEALIDYAKQASAQTVDKWITKHGTEPVDPVTAFHAFQRVFEAEARERLAQISQALWMEREGDVQDARSSSIVVDEIPLSSLEEAIYGSMFSTSFARSEGMASKAILDAAYTVKEHRRALAQSLAVGR